MRFSKLILFNCLGLTALHAAGQNSADLIPIPIVLNESPKALPLSTMLDIQQIIPLETTPKNLLPEQFTIVPMKDYIVIINPSASIQLYSNKGKYLKTLARRGNGPNEFYMILSYATDRDKNIFYYSDRASPLYIHAIDLVKGVQREKISLPLEKITTDSKIDGLKNLVLIDGKTFVCVPSAQAGMIYPVFSMTTEGKFLKGFPHAKNQDFSTQNYSVSEFENTGHYLVNNQKTYDNSLLVLTDKPEPYATFEIKDPNGISAVENIFISIQAEGPTAMIVQVATISTVKNAEGKIGLTVNKPQFLIDKKNKRSSSVSTLSIDYLGGIEIKYPFVQVNEGLGAVKVNALELRAHAKEILKKGNADATLRTRLENILSSIKDDDNPVVLVGRLK